MQALTHIGPRSPISCAGLDESAVLRKHVTQEMLHLAASFKSTFIICDMHANCLWLVETISTHMSYNYCKIYSTIATYVSSSQMASG